VLGKRLTCCDGLPISKEKVDQLPSMPSLCEFMLDWLLLFERCCMARQLHDLERV
jgi:hypothetical protein